MNNNTNNNNLNNNNNKNSKLLMEGFWDKTKTGTNFEDFCDQQK